MKFVKSLTLAVIVAAPLFFGAQVSQAQDHPNYIRALADLRLMHSYLTHVRQSPPDVEVMRAHALHEIEAAYNEVKEAAIQDGKDVNTALPVDANITPADHYRKAREAGNAAWADINKEEDNGFAHGLKHRALDHIEEANHTLDKIERFFGSM
jgi:hypothetical protein